MYYNLLWILTSVFKQKLLIWHKLMLLNQIIGYVVIYDMLLSMTYGINFYIVASLIGTCLHTVILTWEKLHTYALPCTFNKCNRKKVMLTNSLVYVCATYIYPP